MKHVFIIGSKGIPANYGGFETFVEKLTEKKVSQEIKYHVACLSDHDDEFTYNDARCFNVKVPQIGPAKAVYYDLAALNRVVQYIAENQLRGSIVYVLACRVGPFVKKYQKKLHQLDCKLYVNPDGHEWKRAKWNFAIKKYWKLSERYMIKNTDLAICDSVGIEDYIKESYGKYQPKTTFIAYGADVDEKEGNQEKLQEWYKQFNLKEYEYYLIVGRFVPENNFETMIKEFMNSKTKRDLVIITNVENNKFYDNLLKNTDFKKDERIKFVGTVYDQELLKAIREKAYAYIHGHSVGGTNPSLLEALATTSINLLLNVNFNVEVGKEAAIYWGKTKNNLCEVINTVDVFSKEYAESLGNQAKQIIKECYSWDKIIHEYEELFLK